jgi:hypothetical protein
MVSSEYTILGRVIFSTCAIGEILAVGLFIAMPFEVILRVDIPKEVQGVLAFR